MLSSSDQGKKKKTERCRFPNLIFGEQHQDAVSEQIFLQLLSKLNELGYTSYFAESFESLEKKQQKNVQLIENFCDPNWMLGPEASHQLSWLLQATNEGALLSSLADYNISYTPIDIPHLDVAEGLNETPARDAAMSKAYLTTSEQVFGNVGLGHLPGIQQQLIDSLGQEAAAQKFLFIIPASAKELKEEFDSHEEFDELGIKSDAYVRKFAGVSGIEIIKNLPLNCVFLDSDTMSIDQMCTQILEAIKKHRAQSAANLPSVSESKSSFFANANLSQAPLQKPEDDLSFQNKFLQHYRPEWYEFQDWRPQGTITKEMAVAYAHNHPESAVATALTEMNIEFNQMRPQSNL